MNTSNHYSRCSGRRSNRAISRTREQSFIATPTRSMTRRHELQNDTWNLHRPEDLSLRKQVFHENRKHRILNITLLMVPPEPDLQL
jgi:hypothetical protein